jgi:hypothetical protein
MMSQKLRQIFATNDGSLPDIYFNFQGERMVAEAYTVVQQYASSLVSQEAYYWSKTTQRECPIQLGDNPAVHFLSGEAECFHVVFGGVTSATGSHIPDLGVSVLNDDFFGLDYRMGPEWSDRAIVGLLDLMCELANLSAHTVVTHETNMFDPDGKILLNAFAQRFAAKKISARLQR